MAETKDQPSVAPQQSQGGMGNKILFGLLGLNMVVIATVAVVLVLAQKKQAQIQTLDQVESGSKEGGGHGPASEGHGGGDGHGGGKPAAPAAADVKFFSLGDFTTNLAGPDGHYVKLSVNFQVSKEADEEELKLRRPQFRDKVIALMNSRKPADLESPDNRSTLKDEIKTVANQYISKGKVEGVYFSTFTIN